MSLSLVVLISGRGSNLQALIDARERLHIYIRRVISNRPGAAGLQRAQAAGIATTTLDHTGFASRDEFDEALAAAIAAEQPDLIVLAGFMRILSESFVQQFQGRMINIHPSLLPLYPGLHTYRRALEAGDRDYGSSVHFVTPDVDGGPVISQVAIPIRAGDQPEEMAARLLPLEHRLLVSTVELFACSRVQWRDEQVYLDNEQLAQPLRCFDET